MHVASDNKCACAIMVVVVLRRSVRHKEHVKRRKQQDAAHLQCKNMISLWSPGRKRAVTTRLFAILSRHLGLRKCVHGCSHAVT